MISAALFKSVPIRSGITNSDGCLPILTIIEIVSFLATVSLTNKV